MTTGPSKRKPVVNQNLRDYEVEQNQTNGKYELEMLFHSIQDAVLGRLCALFVEGNSHLICALTALDHEADRANL